MGVPSSAHTSAVIEAWDLNNSVFLFLYLRKGRIVVCRQWAGGTFGDMGHPELFSPFPEHLRCLLLPISTGTCGMSGKPRLAVQSLPLSIRRRESTAGISPSLLVCCRECQMGTFCLTMKSEKAMFRLFLSSTVSLHI